MIALKTTTATTTTTTTCLLISLHEWHTYVPKQMIIDLHVLKEIIMHFNTVCIEIFYNLISDGTKFAPAHKFIYLIKNYPQISVSSQRDWLWQPPPSSWQCVVNNPKFDSWGQISIYRSIHLRLEFHIWPQQVGFFWWSYELFHYFQCILSLLTPRIDYNPSMDK